MNNEEKIFGKMNNIMNTLQNQADQCSLPIKITKLERVEDEFDSHIAIYYNFLSSVVGSSPPWKENQKWRTRGGGSVWDFIPETLRLFVFEFCNHSMEQAYQQENLADFIRLFSETLNMWEQGKKWNVLEEHQKFSDHWDLSQFLLKAMILVQKQPK